MNPRLFVVACALSASGCSVLSAGVAVTSAAVSVGSAVVSTTVTVGAAAVRGAVKVGERVVDMASTPSPPEAPPQPARYDSAALSANAEARPIELAAPIDQRELPNSPPSIDRPCCTN